VVDSELAAFAALLQGLASSSAREAKRLVQGGDAIIVLREPGPRQIFNTERSFGAELPPAVPIPAADLATFAAGRRLVSDVYLSPLSGEPRVAIALPILKDGTVAHILAITFPTTRIRDALPAVSPGWIVSVGDKNGTMVTRSVRHDEISGKPGLPEYLAKAVGRSGAFTATSFEGTRLLAGYYRSELSEWLVGANIAEAVVEAPLWRSLIALASLGAAALTISAILAYLFGTTFTAATAGVAERAAALGEGRPVSPMPSRLIEFAAVSEALADAAAAIEQRAREREQSEQQRQLLVNELNHRVKNTLATVQSIVLQTLRGSASITQANEAISSRLVALAQAHDVLTRESWEGAELHDLAVDVTRPHGGTDRFTIGGPQVWLPPALALSLALALHELATNASKYGSLSSETGTVALEWDVVSAPEKPRLVLQWSERGGPPVTPPTRQGFGTRLIQRSLAEAIGGNVAVDYQPQGLVCRIEAPLPPPDAERKQVNA
jgi:two-component sensor histidine kinase